MKIYPKWIQKKNNMARDEVNTAAAVLNLLTRPNRPSLFYLFIWHTCMFKFVFFICVIIMLNWKRQSYIFELVTILYTCIYFMLSVCVFLGVFPIRRAVVVAYINKVFCLVSAICALPLCRRVCWKLFCKFQICSRFFCIYIKLY